eukprot:gnl/Dysnectes_brevis/6159_a9331_341.p1 GENE.gnl/Dysnectes_brevis/6159_a9331_341~~gnl/Dysnectes_brevis/6159_a9331_341.p1  ORF type:complete len:290 (+),score=36.72 gnl/Dysnectes_brevis/6159_a9331_341:55-924(+)
MNQIFKTTRVCSSRNFLSIFSKASLMLIGFLVLLLIIFGDGFVSNFDLNVMHLLYDDDAESFIFKDSPFVEVFNDSTTMTLICIFIIAITVALSTIIFYKRTSGHLRIWFILAPILTAGIAGVIVSILKVLLNRPRPKNTNLFSPLDPSDTVDCRVDYMPIFRGGPPTNPCGLSLKSAPSGHTQFWTSASFSPLLPIIAAAVRADNHGTRWMAALATSACAILALLLTLIGGVCRWLVGSHYPSDTLFGALIGVAVWFVALLMMPVAEKERVDNVEIDTSVCTDARIES